PVSRSCSRYTSTTLPGMPRHIGRFSGTGAGRIVAAFQGGRNDQLPEAQAAVARGDAGVAVDAEPVARQPVECSGQEDGVEEDAAAQDDGVQSGFGPQPAAHVRDYL